jgi:hypothetical protein
MRSGVKIGEKGDAQRAPPSRPAVDLQAKTANDVPLRAADLRKPSLAAQFVAKGRAQEGAGQSASRAMRRDFAHVSLHHSKPVRASTEQKFRHCLGEEISPWQGAFTRPMRAERRHRS